MPTQNINLDWSAGVDSVSKRITITADGEANVEVEIPDASTDLEVVISIDFSALKLLFMVADQDLTIETNNGTTPDDTISLTADKPLVWFEQSGYSNPLTMDVTNMFVTNNSGSAAKLIIKTLQDATP
ncbi:hypothetical protein [Gimesia aquarii]|uniref:Uncharacterized protein n=1 Tax=Gimesia aquarii TaxID=2527964 RepID=A0A517VRB6_9PLAN|nr:hypothetical protein [Gimesia aquarii]QDT95553.1 hypothetical protein V144x_09980 [Gimesia aquarii]